MKVTLFLFLWGRVNIDTYLAKKKKLITIIYLYEKKVCQFMLTLS